MSLPNDLKLVEKIPGASLVNWTERSARVRWLVSALVGHSLDHWVIAVNLASATTALAVNLAMSALIKLGRTWQLSKAFSCVKYEPFNMSVKTFYSA